MDLNNFLVTLSQTADAEKPSLFPFPFTQHLIFVIICVLFFAYRFTVQKKPYQFIMCLAVAASLGLWLSESRAVYYGVGALEAVMLVGAFVTSLIFRDKPKDESAKKDDNSDNDNDNGSDDCDEEDEETAILAATTVNNILNS